LESHLAHATDSWYGQPGFLEIMRLVVVGHERPTELVVLRVGEEEWATLILCEPLCQPQQLLAVEATVVPLLLAQSVLRWAPVQGSDANKQTDLSAQLI